MRETIMKKNIVLIFLFCAHYSFSASAVVETEATDFVNDLILAPQDQEAFKRIETALEQNPELINIRGEISGEMENNLSVVHLAVYANQADELGIKLLDLLKKCGADFNAVSGRSDNRLNSELNPLAFLLYHASKTNADKLIPILVQHGTSGSHPSVMLAVMFRQTKR